MRQTNETRKPTATPNGKTAGKTAKKSITRTERWHRLAEESIARLDEKSLPGLIMLRTCAEVEGMHPADLIVDRLKRARFGGKIVEERPADFCGEEYNAWIDTDHERNMSTRARNSHEYEVVSSMLWMFIDCAGLTHDLVRRYGRRFVLNLYRRGDMGIGPAFHRMVSAALAGLKSAAN